MPYKTQIIMRHTEKNMIEILKHFYLTETYFMKEMEILEQEEEGTHDKWYEEFYNALTSAREVAKKVFSEAMEIEVRKEMELTETPNMTR